MERGGEEDPGDGGDDGGPEDVADELKAGEIAVEEEDGEDDSGDGYGGGGGGDEASEVPGVGGKRGGEVSGVLGEADASAGDGEGRGEDELEDEEEGEEAAEPAGIDGAKEAVGAAGFGHGGAEFSPDEAVTDGEEGPEDPAEHGLGASHGGEEEGEGDEGADADHVEHVDGDGRAEGEGAGELGCGGDEASVTKYALTPGGRHIPPQRRGPVAGDPGLRAVLDASRERRGLGVRD